MLYQFLTNASVIMAADKNKLRHVKPRWDFPGSDAIILVVGVVLAIFMVVGLIIAIAGVTSGAKAVNSGEGGATSGFVTAALGVLVMVICIGGGAFFFDWADYLKF